MALAVARKIKRHIAASRGRLRLAKALGQGSPLKLIIGASGTSQGGWIAMDAAYLDLSSARDWDRFFRPHSIAAILAEHVWEHLTPEQGLTAAKMCYRYLRAGGHLRIAVPDGFPPDPTYINWVRVGGVGDGADDHKVLYTYATLSGLLRTAGFDVTLQEYFDERGTFHGQESDRNDGSVRRSKRYDPRNAGGDLKYTSIIIDGCVPEGAGEPAVP